MMMTDAAMTPALPTLGAVVDSWVSQYVPGRTRITECGG